MDLRTSGSTDEAGDGGSSQSLVIMNSNMICQMSQRRRGESSARHPNPDSVPFRSGTQLRMGPEFAL